MRQRSVLSWRPWFGGWLLLCVACGNEDDTKPSGSGGGAGTGMPQAGSGSGGTSGSGGNTAGGTAGGSAGGGTGFEQCTTKPASTCSKDATCVEASCGMLNSQLDAGGCLRTTCDSDADCGAAELCYPAPVVAQVDMATPRFAPTCTPQGNRCACVGLTLATGAKAYCAPSATVFGEWGCVTRPSVMDDCTALADWLSGAESLLASLTLEATVRTRAQACVTAASDHHQQTCM